jgi:hypothetical protein
MLRSGSQLFAGSAVPSRDRVRSFVVSPWEDEDGPADRGLDGQKDALNGLS